MAMNEKPKCPLIGANGNIYNLLGMASRTLRENGMREQAKEMQEQSLKRMTLLPENVSSMQS